MKNEHGKNLGFTIVELVVTITIIGILFTIAAISYNGITSRAKTQKLQSDLLNAVSQVNRTKESTGKYPSDKDSLDASAKPSFDSGVTYDYHYSSSADRFCIEASFSGESYFIQSSNGNVSQGSCPAMPKASFVAVWGNGEYGNIDNSVIQTADGGYVTTGCLNACDSNAVGNSLVVISKYAADGSLSWVRRWNNGNSTDRGTGYRIIQTSDGGYAVTGSHTEMVGYFGDDMFLLKLTADGSVSWYETWRVDGYYVRGASLIQTTDGSLVVSGTMNADSGNHNEVFIVKYSSSGSLIWNRTWGGSDDDDCSDIVQATDGGYILTGYTRSFGAGSEDMFILRLDANGDSVWGKTWGGTGVDNGNSIILSPDGGFIVTGTTQLLYRQRAFLSKYTNDGSLLWTRIFGGDNEDIAYDVVKTDSGYVVAGSTTSYGVGQQDVLLTKFSLDGTWIWSRTWGGSGQDVASSLVQSNDGGYVIVGYTTSYGNETNDYAMIIKFDSSGHIENCLSSVCINPAVNVFSTTTNVLSSIGSMSLVNPSANTSSALSYGHYIDTVPLSSLTILGILPVLQQVTSTPTMTLTFSGEELYIPFPGDNQTQCKQWTVPNGKTIKGFTVSQATELNYDYFYVNSDGVERYRNSGNATNSYVDISSTPGTVLQACLYADGGVQAGYGGQVTAVLYN